MDELVRNDDTRQLVILLASAQVLPVTITCCSFGTRQRLADWLSNASLKRESLRERVTVAIQKIIQTEKQNSSRLPQFHRKEVNSEHLTTVALEEVAGIIISIPYYRQRQGPK